MNNRQEPLRPAPTCIALVGMMGAGKSTVGRKLATRLGWNFVDTDDQVEKVTGQSVADVWSEVGEPGFRRMEEQAVVSLLQRGDRSVVALGGGAVLSRVAREALKTNSAVIWLRASLGTLMSRVGVLRQPTTESTGRTRRPLLGDDPRSVLTRLLASRTALYEEVADLIVDVDGRRIREVVDEVAGWVALQRGEREPSGGGQG